MSVKPKLSIITICFNAESYIKPTLDSVANQTFKDLVHVIVDGKSTDSTMIIVDSFPHIQNKVSESDNGLYDAMNKGIDRANGEYLCFMNGGDLFYDNNHKPKTRILDELWEKIGFQFLENKRYDLASFYAHEKRKNKLITAIYIEKLKIIPESQLKLVRFCILKIITNYSN